MMTDTEKTILRTLIFFDVFDHPLTPFELWKYAYHVGGQSRCSLSTILHELRTSPSITERTEKHNGVYTLTGRGALVRLRRERTVYADQKYAIAQKITRVFAWFPFVRMVCVCNTVGFGVAKKESDIDLFIVAQARHVWLVRLLCTGYAHLLDKRPRRDAVRDTLCLSFYASDDALDFSSLAQLPIGEMPDIYFLYWMTWCVPIYDDGVYELFFTENRWVENMIPNRIQYLPTPHRRVTLSHLGRGGKKIMEGLVSCFGPLLEAGARAVQYAVMPRILREKQSEGTGVVVSDSVLKFHVSDRRRAIQEECLRRWKEMQL